MAKVLINVKKAFKLHIRGERDVPQYLEFPAGPAMIDETLVDHDWVKIHTRGATDAQRDDFEAAVQAEADRRLAAMRDNASDGSGVVLAEKVADEASDQAKKDAEAKAKGLDENDGKEEEQVELPTDRKNKVRR